MHKQAQSCICSGASGRVRKSCFVFPRLWCCRLIMAGSFHSISFVKSSRASIPGHGPRCNQATVFLVVLDGCEVKELDQDVKWTVRGASRTLSPEMMVRVRLSKMMPAIRHSKKAGQAGYYSTHGRWWWTRTRTRQGWKRPSLYLW